MLRIGAWELLFNDDVPDAVAIDEAVELARTLSTDESPAFVNGLLARLLEVKPSVAPDALRPGRDERRRPVRQPGSRPLRQAAGGVRSRRGLRAQSSAATARRASALRTPQAISCSASTAGGTS